MPDPVDIEMGKTEIAVAPAAPAALPAIASTSISPPITDEMRRVKDRLIASVKDAIKYFDDNRGWIGTADINLLRRWHEQPDEKRKLADLLGILQNKRAKKTLDKIKEREYVTFRFPPTVLEEALLKITVFNDESMHALSCLQAKGLLNWGNLIRLWYGFDGYIFDVSSILAHLSPRRVSRGSKPVLMLDQACIDCLCLIKTIPEFNYYKYLLNSMYILTIREQLHLESFEFLCRAVATHDLKYLEFVCHLTKARLFGRIYVRSDLDEVEYSSKFMTRIYDSLVKYAKTDVKFKLLCTEIAKTKSFGRLFSVLVRMGKAGILNQTNFNTVLDPVIVGGRIKRLFGVMRSKLSALEPIDQVKLDGLVKEYSGSVGVKSAVKPGAVSLATRGPGLFAEEDKSASTPKGKEAGEVRGAEIGSAIGGPKS